MIKYCLPCPRQRFLAWTSPRIGVAMVTSRAGHTRQVLGEMLVIYHLLLVLYTALDALVFLSNPKKIELES